MENRPYSKHNLSQFFIFPERTPNSNPISFMTVFICIQDGAKISSCRPHGNGKIIPVLLRFNEGHQHHNPFMWILRRWRRTHYGTKPWTDVLTFKRKKVDHRRATKQADDGESSKASRRTRRQRVNPIVFKEVSQAIAEIVREKTGPTTPSSVHRPDAAASSPGGRIKSQLRNA